MKNKIFIASVLVFTTYYLYAQEPMDMELQNKYVSKNIFRSLKYEETPLPVFSDTRLKLPQPIFEEEPGYVEMYWKTWEMAFNQFRQPAPSSPFVSNYIDEAFNEALFLWDTAFMTMFCNYGFSYVPGIQSLDNFYYSQMEDGEIVREIDENTGEPRILYAAPGTPASLNHPLLAWAEVESFRITNDTSRLEKVFYPLAAYFYSFNKIKDPISGLFYGSWASMDNSPRIPGMLCSIDTSSEVVLFAKNLAFIAEVLGLGEERKKFEREAKTISDLINKTLWCDETGFYYDLNKDQQIHNVKTIAAFWTLLAEIADKTKARRLAEILINPSEFKRTHMVPTVPASEPEFDPKGGYWKGGVWSPTTVMVIEGLKKYGYDDHAKKVAINHLVNVYEVFKETGTLWEFYQPDFIDVGYQHGHKTRPDFTGWTALAPIKLFIEHLIGVNINAPENHLVWNISSEGRTGILNLAFGDNYVDLIAEKSLKGQQRIIQVGSKNPFKLTMNYNGQQIIKILPAGISNFRIG